MAVIVKNGAILKSMKKQSKYRNQKVIVNGKKIADSKKENKRLNELRLLERAGIIEDLQTQVKYELQPSYKIGNKTIKSINYIADFVYKEKYQDLEHTTLLKFKTVIEDVKGYRTEIYKLKKKMFEFRYGIEIKEI